MNKNKKKNEFSILPIIFIIAVFIMSNLRSTASGSAAVIIAVVAVIAVIVIIVSVLGKVKKFAGSSAQRAEQLEKLFAGKDTPKEEAITCSCKHGRDKYLSQADEWYKNGLIEKEEYRLLRKHYQEIELPEGIVD